MLKKVTKFKQKNSAFFFVLFFSKQKLSISHGINSPTTITTCPPPSKKDEMHKNVDVALAILKANSKPEAPVAPRSLVEGKAVPPSRQQRYIRE